MKKIIGNIIYTIVLIVLLSSSCVGIAYLYKENNKLQKFEVITEKIVYEYGEPVYLNLSDLIQGDMRQVEMKTELMTDTLLYSYDRETGLVKSRNSEYLACGKYTVVFQRQLEDGVETKRMVIEVADTTPPEFVSWLEDIYIMKGQGMPDLSGIYVAQDLQGCAVTYDIAEIDLKTVGEYTLTITAEDPSGNKSDYIANVYVVSG